jgi:thiol-disulfide isomerase/thioredoxin
MTRYWAVALLALLALLPLAGAARAGDKEFKVEDSLTKDDPKEKRTQGMASKVFPYKMKAGQIYVIRMTSDEIDCFLFLDDPAGKQLAENDDESNGTYNSKIVFKCEKDGEYKIVCSCYPKPVSPKLGVTGKFTLTVRAGTKDDLSVHDRLVGMAAPEIAGVFSLNGQTKKLTDLKGKVVMVDFWAVWCGPCIATFPHLIEWSKEYQKDGLEILGVTTYFEQFGFDKTTGKLTKAANKLKQEEENDMLKDFVGYHKLTHRILAVPQKSWEQASKDYGVEGIPQVVLIDRKGVVRMIKVGNTPANTAAIHDMIKLLLAEK